MTHTSTENRAGTRSIWVFMAATAMATTVSTLAATAMARADAPATVDVTCECDTPTLAATAAPAVAPAPTSSPVAQPQFTESGKPTGPRVRQAKPTVDGDFDQNIIRRIVRAHINEVRYCYNQGLSRNPELGGRVYIQFTIGGDGKVATAAVSSSDLGDDAVGTCIASAVERWKFPKPTDGSDVTVTYPFVLSAG